MKRLLKLCRVPTLSDFYDYSEYDFINIGRKTVNVNDIVGMSDGRNEEYNDDFYPIDKNDSRWQYQKNLIDQGKSMEPIPLIKMPDGKFVGNGDGSHRISVAKVSGLQEIIANVTVMIPKDAGINDAWEEHAKGKIQHLEEMSKKYKGMYKEYYRLQDEAFNTRDFTKYRAYEKKMNDLGREISELDEELLKEEKEFKDNLVDEYINK